MWSHIFIYFIYYFFFESRFFSSQPEGKEHTAWLSPILSVPRPLPIHPAVEILPGDPLLALSWLALFDQWALLGRVLPLRMGCPRRQLQRCSLPCKWKCEKQNQTPSTCFHFGKYYFVVLGTELRASCMLNESCNPGLHHQLPFPFYFAMESH